MRQNTTQLELFQEHLNSKNDFSIYPNLTCTLAKEAHQVMRKVIKNLTTPIESTTKDTVMLGAYKLGLEPTRANKNVVSVSALVFDIDDPRHYTFDQLVEMACPYSGIIHTTWSHTEQKPRYRLIINLIRSIPAHEFEGTRDGFLFLNPKLEEIIDKACKDISRAYFLFSYPPERAEIAQCCVLMGTPLDPSHFRLPNYPEASNAPDLFTPSPLQKILQGGINEGGRNNSLATLVGGLITKGNTKDETLRTVVEWNKTLIPPLEMAELNRTHDNIWRIHESKHPESNPIENKVLTKPKSFCLIPAANLLATDPPKREWVIQDFLPRKIVGSIIAAGGTGKSFLAMHIAVSVSSGSSLFCRFQPTRPMKVIFISGEDDCPELQRRLHKATSCLPIHIRNNINANLHFMDLADSFELFTAKTNKGEVSITDVPSLICEQINSEIGSDIGLVIIDPISRFRGGEENMAADTTRFVQALQQIRDRLNTCVLTLHHVNKQSGGNGASQNNARGSSAFIDGVRLVYQLNNLTDTEVEKMYGKSSLTPKLLTLQSVKSNYGRPIEPITLSRKDDGSLELFGMVAGDHQKKAILQEIRISGLSKTQFKDTYGDAKGKFALSEKALIKKLDEFVEAKLLVTPSRSPMFLTDLGQKMLDS